MRLYQQPLYYDIAASWDITADTRALHAIFDAHAAGPVEHILECACGSGRYLAALAGEGWHLTGYDLSVPMVTYAAMHMPQDTPVQVLAADMAAIRFAPSFDAAINLAGSFGYLLPDEDVLAHLRNTSHSLRPAGLYIIQIACAHSGSLPHQPAWVHQRGPYMIRTSWNIVEEDREAQRCIHRCLMVIDDGQRTQAINEDHTLRLWTYPNLVEIIQASGTFALQAIYDQQGQQLALDSPISGEHGNLYYVLQKTPAPNP